MLISLGRFSRLLNGISIIFITTGAYSQKLDSTQLAKKNEADSLKAIPLILQRIENNFITTLHDTNSYVLQGKTFFGLTSLNNYGSPVNSLRDQDRMVEGFDYAYSLQDFMTRDIESVPLYLTNKTYSELLLSESEYFASSQGSLIDNINVGVFLAKNFAKGVHINLTYDRINCKGIYLQSRNLLTRLSAKVAFVNDKSRWSGELSYLNQYDNIEHSGGVLTDSILANDNYQIREAVPVINTQAFRRISGDQINYRMRYRFHHDSSIWKSFIEAGIGYKEYQNNFSDNTSHDTLNFMYGTEFYNFRDSIYSDYSHHIIPGSVSWSFSIAEKIKVQYHGLFEQVFLNQDRSYSADIAVSNNKFSLEYRGIKDQTFLASALFKSQGNNNGYDLGLGYSISKLKNIELNFSFNQSKIIPGWLYNRFTVKNALIRNIDLKATDQTRFFLGVITKYKFVPSLNFQFQNLKNIFYLESNFNIVQPDQNIRKIDATITEEIGIGKLGLFNTFRLIQSKPDPAGWSTWYSRHELYFHNKFLGANSNYRISLFAEWTKPDNINGFHGLYGMYYPRNKNTKVFGPFPGLDLRAQIADLHVRLEFSNFDSFWRPDRPSLIYGYPRYDFNIRIQLLWKFFH